MDGDGVPDATDNCLDVPNGPLLGQGSCPVQADADGDGYGNVCDSDVDNDGATSLGDLSKVLGASAVSSQDPKYDLDCDGAVSLLDVSRVLRDSAVGAPPGPSGYACAGVAPCPVGVTGSPLASALRDLDATSPTSVSGTVTACAMTTLSSWESCAQTVLVFALAANVDVDPPLQQVSVSSDGSWTANGLAAGTLYGFYPKNTVAGGFPETTAIGSASYHATLGAPVTLPNASGGFALAGRTPVSTSVSDRGAATIEIPIRVPPGTAGMAPALSLSYDSLDGNGLIGVGWNLTGFSSIRRCAATILQDGFVDGVDFDGNDRFCWDGERLTPVAAGPYWNGDGSGYRTEIDRIANVRAVGAVGDGPASFTVWTRDGRVLTFAAQALREPSAGVGVHSWGLSKVEDRFGNYLTIAYHNDAASGEFWPTAIDYTGKTGASASAPNASVELVYESRPDILDGHAGAVRRRISQRLARIETTTDGVPVTSYWLAYDDAGPRSRLASLLECGGDEAGQPHCLPSTRFGWEAPEVISAVRHEAASGAPVTLSWMPPTLGDFDGSGKSDMALRVGGTTEIYSSPGLRTTQEPHPAPDFVIPDALLFPQGPGNAVLLSGDFDGDGRDGLVSFEPDSGSVLILNEIDSSAPAPSDSRLGVAPYHKLYVRDFTGDGTDDLLFWNAELGSVQIYPVVNGMIAAFPTTSLLDFEVSDVDPTDPFADTRLYIGDFNGDAVQDLLLASTWLEPDLVTWHNNGTIYPVENGVVGLAAGIIPDLAGRTHVVVGDFNGDGTSDVATQAKVSAVWRTEITLVADGNPAAPILGPVLVGGLGPRLLAADFDGDGTDDLLAFSPDLNFGGSKIYPVRGGVVGASTAEIYTAYGFTDDTLLGDFTGNGLPDLVIHNGTSAIAEILGRAGDRILTLRDGLVADTSGSPVGTRSFAYAPLTDPAVYSGDVSAAGRSGSALYAVSSFGRETPVGVHASQVHYSDGRFDSLRRESLGFASWLRTDQATGEALSRTFLQQHPFIGLVDVQETRIASGQTISREENSWATTAISGSPSPQVYLASATASRWEIDDQPPYDSAPYRVVTTDALALDAYGNVTREETASDDGWTTTLVRTFSNDPGNWWIGLPVRSETTDSNAAELLSETKIIEVTARDAVTGRTLRISSEPGESFELVTAYATDDWGNTTVVTQDPDAVHGPPRLATTLFDARGQSVTLTKNALGHATRHEIDARFGAPTSVTDPNGLVTITSYDPIGRPLLRTTSGQPDVASAYAPCDASCPPGAAMALTRAVAGAAPVTTHYDALGREQLVTTQGFDGRSVEVARSYTLSGELQSLTSPTFAGDTPLTSFYEYDDAGRLVLVTTPDQQTLATTYSGRSRVATRANGSLSQTTTRTLDSRGNLTRVIDALQGTSSYAYGPFDRRLRVTGPDGPTTTIAYTTLSKGHIVETDDPNAGFSTRMLDAYGQTTQVSRVVGGGTVDTTFTYDPLGRLKTRSEPEGLTTWTYDTALHGIGKLDSVDGPNHIVTSSYDQYARTAAVSEEIFGESFTGSVEYDSLGRPQQLVYPTGLRILQVYNSRGQLASVVDDQDTVLWRADGMTADGLLEATTLGSGVVTRFTRDPVTRRLTAVQAGLAGGAEVQGLGIGWDALGRVQDRSDANRLLTGGATFFESFSYDDLNRIEDATIAGGAAVSFAYSPGGRIESKSDVGSYGYGENGAGPDQLTSIAGAMQSAFSYDDHGNVTTGLGRNAVYSSFDKPTFIANASAAATFSYGVDRRRIRQIKAQGGQPTSTTTYVGALYEEVADLATGTTRQRHYVMAGGVRVALIETEGGASRSTRYLHQDHLGSIGAVTDEQGVVLARYFYDVFGRSVDAQGQPLAAGARAETSVRGFTDHEHLDELGLIHANARVLDPALGLFLSVDPVLADANPQDLTPYAYVRNNPLALVDPSGEFAQNLSLAMGLGGLGRKMGQGARWRPPIPEGCTDLKSCLKPPELEGTAGHNSAGFAARVRNVYGKIAARHRLRLFVRELIDQVGSFADGLFPWMAPSGASDSDPFGPNPGSFLTLGVGVDFVLLGGFEANGGVFLGRTRSGELQAGLFSQGGPAVGVALSGDVQAGFITNVDELDGEFSINLNVGFLAANAIVSANPTPPNDGGRFVGDFINGGGAAASFGPVPVEGFVSFSKTRTLDVVEPVRQFFGF